MERSIKMPALETIDVESISKEDLLDIIRLGRPVQIVNVLEREEYDSGSIEGSHKIPFTELAERLDELDRHKEVVVYSGGYHCSACRQAAEKLVLWGLKARVYEGGIDEWKNTGFPMEYGQRKGRH